LSYKTRIKKLEAKRLIPFLKHITILHSIVDVDEEGMVDTLAFAFKIENLKSSMIWRNDMETEIDFKKRVFSYSQSSK